MTMLPLKTAISDTYPNPSNATARAGFATLWDALNEFQQKSELDLASAATCDIGGQASTKLRITGTTGITSFGTNYRGPIMLRFSGAVTLTHNATTLVCPGAANLTTAAGEVLIVWPIASVSGTLDGWAVGRIVRGSGIAPIAEGGTGSGTASGAFAAIKQAATTSATGVVELATDAEAQAGTDATRCVTPDNLGAVVLGLGQTWQDKTSSRALTTTYTNDTGRTIAVSIGGSMSSVSQSLRFSVNGAVIAFSDAAYVAGAWTTIALCLVPPGATYALTTSSGSYTISNWNELR